MDVFHAPNLAGAVELARSFQVTGRYDLFRGQINAWPIKATLIRRIGAERDEAIDKLKRLTYWMSVTPGISHLAKDQDSVFAVAQHYGIPTTFIDLTTDPEIAGFFAADGNHSSEGAFEGSSCIYCINAVDFQASVEDLRGKSLPTLPRLVTISVDNLWRLEAQKCTFLDLPWDGQMLEGDLLSLLLPHDIIIFPYSGPALVPPRDRVYPQRKSGLEILLDEYFHNEKLLAAVQTLKRMHKEGAVLAMGNGWLYDEGSFIDGELPPVHASWNGEVLHGWTTPLAESYDGVAAAAVSATLSLDLSLELESLKADCVDQVSELLSQHPGARSLLVHWRVMDLEGKHLVKPFREGDVPLSRCALNIWDGLRALPYSDRNIAEAIATCLALFAHDLRNGDEGIGGAAQSLFGSTRCVEFGSAYGASRRAVISEAAILAAVREDFVEYARRAELLQSARHLLSSIIVPSRAFDFENFKDLFAAQVIPSQIHLDPYKFVFFSPARVDRFGLC